MRNAPAACMLLAAGFAFLAHEHVLAQQTAQQAQQRRLTGPWYQLYDQGVSAVQRGQWQVAVDNLLEAKRLRPQQSRRVNFVGDRVEAYVPDYYLGRAYVGLGQYTDAETAFKSIEDGKLIVQGDREYNTLQTDYRRARMETAFARVQPYLKTDPDRAQRELDAAQSLGLDASRTASARTQIADARRATETTQQAGGAGGVAGQGQVVQGPIPAPAPAINIPRPEPLGNTAGGGAAAGGAIDTPPQTVRYVVPNLAGLNEQNARTRLRQSNLTIGRVGQSTQATSAVAGTVVTQTPAAGSSVAQGTAVNLTLAAVTRITLNEVDAYRAFLSGNYAAAAQLLEAIVATNGKNPAVPTPRGRLYLASSLAALVIVGDRDSSSLQTARDQIALAGSLAPFSADTRLISPRIRTVLGIQP